jgi:hypothetical protein
MISYILEFIFTNKLFVFSLICAIIGIIFLIIDNNSNFSNEKIVSLTLLLTSYLLIIINIFNYKKQKYRLSKYINTVDDKIGTIDYNNFYKDHPFRNSIIRQELRKGYSNIIKDLY